MKSEQLEVMLFTGTRFSAKQFWEKNDNRNQNNSGESENLEEAAWNGLFKEILPELYQIGGNSSDLILWKIVQADHFLELEYGAGPQMEESYYSLNPYLVPWHQLLS